MKFIWEEKDIEAGWRVLSSSAETECIIGYRYDTTGDRLPQILTLVSLEDGLEIIHFSLQHRVNKATEPLSRGDTLPYQITAATQMAEYLNEYGYKPKTISRYG